jgi:DNA invertase Pin-like site-specific DNA recombinase
MGGHASVERDLIRTRIAEIRSLAKAHGDAWGGPHTLSPAQEKEAIQRRMQALGSKLQELAY